MDLIEKYIYEVVKHLPEDSREDVEKELKSNILDMLPEEYSEENVKQVLTELGDPRKLSKEYRGAKRYLIGPDFFDAYILVLKIVAIVIACVLPFVAVITVFENAESIVLTNVIVKIIVQIFTMIIQAAFQAFAWVTVVFAVIERTGISAKDLPVSNKAWKVDDLKNCTVDNKEKIGIAEPIISIVFGIAFLAVMYYSDTIIGWYKLSDTLDGNSLHVIPFFNKEVIRTFFPFMVIMTAISVVFGILKLVYRKWNYQLATFNLINNLIGTVFTFMFMTNKNLISQDFISELFLKADISISRITYATQRLGLVIAIIVAIMIAWDTVEGFLKARKSL